MTEYSDVVERVRMELEADKWAEGGKYLHLNDSIIETKQLNGDMHYWDLETNSKWTVFNNLSRQTIINRFLRRKAPPEQR